MIERDPAAKALVAIIALLAMSVPATANQEGAVEPERDAFGPLDVQSIMHGHRDADRDRLWHLVKMHEPWRARALRGRGSYIYVWLSTDREDRFAERRIWIDLCNGKLRAGVEIYDEFSDGAGVSHIRQLGVSRPSHGTVKVFFHANDLGRNVAGYKWSVDTSYRKSGSRNCSSACYDSAPDGPGRGKFEHDI